MKRILIVDDDPALCATIENYLIDEGFRVAVAHSAAAARKLIDSTTFDLMVTDLGLPDEDGLSLTRHLRARCQAGIIILTGKGEPIDRVIGLEVGADDYVAKPVMLRELVARIRSVLRRLAPPAPSAGKDARKGWRFGEWTVDVDTRRLIRSNGEEQTMTPAEFDLLLAFVAHPNRVLNRDQLLDLSRGRVAGPFDRSIDVLIGRLRRKIETNPEQPTIIRTVRGAGYMFAAAVTPLS
jgi:two-component system OmpR family response regulator